MYFYFNILNAVLLLVQYFYSVSSTFYMYTVYTIANSILEYMCAACSLFMHFNDRTSTSYCSKHFVINYKHFLKSAYVVDT